MYLIWTAAAANDGEGHKTRLGSFLDPKNPVESRLSDGSRGIDELTTSVVSHFLL